MVNLAGKRQNYLGAISFNEIVVGIERSRSKESNKIKEKNVTSARWPPVAPSEQGPGATYCEGEAWLMTGGRKEQQGAGRRKK